jgi:Protein of unknown function (DUF1572)
MSIANELAELYRRDLTRLVQELSAFPKEETLWQVLPPITNSAANLALHLEGNLREFIGRQLGNIPYSRRRDLEFATKVLPKEDLIRRLQAVLDLIPGIVSGLSGPALEATYPEEVYSPALSTGQFVLSLYGHLNYHLGQIDYLRRMVTKEGAIELATLR